MANNKNLIVAYFKNEHAAEMAADGLKDWDHACPDIKLGGIGILTMDDGDVKTHMVGGTCCRQRRQVGHNQCA